jgi:hypothetical protein
VRRLLTFLYRPLTLIDTSQEVILWLTITQPSLLSQPKSKKKQRFRSRYLILPFITRQAPPRSSTSRKSRGSNRKPGDLSHLGPLVLLLTSLSSILIPSRHLSLVSLSLSLSVSHSQNDPVSQKIISNQQPHLEAFLNLKSKKKHSLDLVKKMLQTLPETSAMAKVTVTGLSMMVHRAL